jgi:hypothetical protein
MKKVLATGATQNYLPVISPYLETISAHSNFDVNILVALDCRAEAPSNVKVAYLSNSVVTIRHSNNCLQHGEFMRAEAFAAFSEEDIICFTDGDILMQRALSQAEISLMESLSDNDVLVQFNAGKDDNLHEEYYRLQPGLPHHHLEFLLGVDFRSLGCFNTGVVACNKKTWGEILRLYTKYFPLVKEHAIFGHYASQQWILSLVLARHMNVMPMAPSFHSHSHHGRISGSRFVRSVHHHDDKVVLLSHFAMSDGLPLSKEGYVKHQEEYLRRNLRKFGWRRYFRILG